ncbi:MAG: NifB/NifX family molybdenum-iron cluster-binding protein [Planctomycetota bacterium]
MRICIPVKKDDGLHSRVSAHFGSAPTFLIVDTETEVCRALGNTNRHHAHGRCRPLAQLGGESLDAVVVGGIGSGAFLALRGAGIAVIQSDRKTVAETLAALKAGELMPVDDRSVCVHHGQGPHGPGHGLGPGHGHGPGPGCGHRPGGGRGVGPGAAPEARPGRGPASR